MFIDIHSYLKRTRTVLAISIPFNYHDASFVYFVSTFRLIPMENYNVPYRKQLFNLVINIYRYIFTEENCQKYCLHYDS